MNEVMATLAKEHTQVTFVQVSPEGRAAEGVGNRGELLFDVWVACHREWVQLALKICFDLFENRVEYMKKMHQKHVG